MSLRSHVDIFKMSKMTFAKLLKPPRRRDHDATESYCLTNESYTSREAIVGVS